MTGLFRRAAIWFTSVFRWASIFVLFIASFKLKMSHSCGDFCGAVSLLWFVISAEPYRYFIARDSLSNLSKLCVLYTILCDAHFLIAINYLYTSFRACVLFIWKSNRCWTRHGSRLITTIEESRREDRRVYAEIASSSYHICKPKTNIFYWRKTVRVLKAYYDYIGELNTNKNTIKSWKYDWFSHHQPHGIGESTTRRQQSVIN